MTPIEEGILEESPEKRIEKIENVTPSKQSSYEDTISDNFSD